MLSFNSMTLLTQSVTRPTRPSQRSEQNWLNPPVMSSQAELISSQIFEKKSPTSLMIFAKNSPMSEKMFPRNSPTLETRSTNHASRSVSTVLRSPNTSSMLEPRSPRTRLKSVPRPAAVDSMINSRISGRCSAKTMITFPMIVMTACPSSSAEFMRPSQIARIKSKVALSSGPMTSGAVSVSTIKRNASAT